MKTKIFYFTILLLLGQSLLAQIPSSVESLKSNQSGKQNLQNPQATNELLADLQTQQFKFIVDAVKSSFVILHTTYQLEDINTKKRFNIEGNDGYFGESYTIAIKTAEGLMIENAALRPWQYDNNFDFFIEDKKYEPVISKVEYRMLDDTTFTEYPGIIKFEETKPIMENMLYAVTNHKLGKKGLNLKSLEEKNKGFLVWAYSNKSLDSMNYENMNFVASYFELNSEENKSVYEINKSQINKNHVVLGGIYILPEITDLGEISFRVLGIFQSYQEKLLLIPVENASSSSSEQPANPKLPNNKVPILEQDSGNKGKKVNK